MLFHAGSGGGVRVNEGLLSVMTQMLNLWLPLSNVEPVASSLKCCLSLL